MIDYIAVGGKARQDLDYEIDGIVIKVDSLRIRSNSGSLRKVRDGQPPINSLRKKCVTRLLDIELSVGRTGVVTPTAILEPVRVAGTTVGQCFPSIMRI